MELRDYLRIVRRRWKLIFATVLVAVAAAALVTVRTTPLYASTARLFVSSSQSDTADAYQGGLFSQQRVTSYADLITGERVAQRVINRLGLDTTAAQLSEKLSSTVAPETVILEVTVTDPAPLRAEQIASAVADEFTGLVDELETPPGRGRALVKVSVVDPPNVPEAPVSPQPLRKIGLAAVLGLLLGIGFAVLSEILDTTVKSSQDVVALTDAAVLGSIRYDPQAAKKPLVTDLHSHNARVESLRVLRTNLQFVDIDQPSKCFVVTSSVPAEGKTTTATNLAIILAQASHRVALVEGDLRRPRIAEYLRLENAVGLTTALIGRLDVEDALQPWGKDGLQVLTSGAIPPNPAELLQSEAMTQLLDKLRLRFDIIVIDGPPLLPVTDAAVLTAKSDGAILVVRQGKTTRDEVTQSVERLTAVDARLLGSLLNMTPDRGPDSYSYGYGYAPRADRRQRARDNEPAEGVRAPR